MQGAGANRAKSFAGAGAQALAPHLPRPRRRRDWGRVVFILLMLLPAFAALGLFMYYPIEETFRQSLNRASGLGDAAYVGLANYRQLFANEEFRAGFLNVLLWAFWSVVVQIPLAFFVAFSLSNYQNPVTQPLRAIYYLANILPSAITAMVGSLVFGNTNGVISSLARNLNIGWLQKMDFLGDRRLAFPAVFIVATWMYSGFYIVYLMARIEQIPTEIREAAHLDGADGWLYARTIVLPMVRYPLRIIAVLCIVGSMKVFDLPFLMTRGGPADATKTLSIILYNRGFRDSQYGLAAAVGVVIFALSLVFTILQFSVQRRGGELE
jgi:raffinose/stachyose/melibiose transport system permease protein